MLRVRIRLALLLAALVLASPNARTDASPRESTLSRAIPAAASRAIPAHATTTTLGAIPAMGFTTVNSSVAAIHGAYEPVDAEQALGGGWGDWWAGNSKNVLTAAACLLDGIGIARLLAVGIPGVGGAAVAAGIVLAALGCV